MASVLGCEFPDDLHYDVETNVWARREGDGTVTVGMTSYACSLSGHLVSFLPKPVGKDVKRGRSCATVESGKWVGPVKAPVGGEIMAVNEVVLNDPGRVNEAPYTEGWLFRMRPHDWAGESPALATGAGAMARFQEKMEADGFGGC